MKKLILAAIACVSVCSPAWAGVSGLHNTGADGIGVADPYYTLTAVPSGPSTALGIAKHSAWIGAPDDALWIAPTAAGVSDPVGWYTYELNFTVDGVDLSSVVITGKWSVDNAGKILLNGVDTGIAKGNTITDTLEHKTLSDFTISSGFQSGENTLEFYVYNRPGTGGNPTGLLVSSLVARAAPIPAPGAVLLGMMGTGLVGWMRRRRTL